MSLALHQTERDFQAAVIDLAHLRRWHVAHFRTAHTPTGFRTPVAADGAGFPDLVLVRDRVLFIELKSQRGHVSHAQHDWHDRLIAAGADAHVFRPSDWPTIERVLA